MAIYNSITELIGKTPLVQLSTFTKNRDLKANVIAKVEFFNPGGSVKDRIALSMILDAVSDCRSWVQFVATKSS